MTKEEDWFPQRSDFVEETIRFIKIAQEVERNVCDELMEAIEEASRESGLKLDINIFDD